MFDRLCDCPTSAIKQRHRPGIFTGWKPPNPLHGSGGSLGRRFPAIGQVSWTGRRPRQCKREGIRGFGDCARAFCLSLNGPPCPVDSLPKMSGLIADASGMLTPLMSERAATYLKPALVGAAGGWGACGGGAAACLPFSFAVSIGASRSCCSIPLLDTS